MSLRGACIILLAYLPMACQTGAPDAPIVVPRPLVSYFAACAPTDGAGVLQLMRSGSLLISTDLEWKTQASEQYKNGSYNGADWDVQLSDPLGNTLLKWMRRQRAGDKQIVTEGRLAERVPTTSVDADGYIEVDGHRLGLKAAELPCLLNGQAPRAWLLLATAVETDCGRGRCNKSDLQLRDAGRSIGMHFSFDQNRRILAVCSDIRWQRFLGLWRGHLQWCQAGKGLREMTLSGYEDFSLRMVRHDE